jgi:hypothetical protein
MAGAKNWTRERILVQWGGLPPRPTGVSDRDWEIFRQVIEGHRIYRDVGAEHGIQGVRVNQIVWKIERKANRPSNRRKARERVGEAWPVDGYGRFGLPPADRPFVRCGRCNRRWWARAVEHGLHFFYCSRCEAASPIEFVAGEG